jgi:acetyltransferase-like isoleucine patch superfamily enzyme
MDERSFRASFLAMMDNVENPFHPLVWIHGDPEVGEGTYIGGFSEVNAKGAKVRIGRHCDIASFVAINVADSHLQTIGLSPAIERHDIDIGDHVFIGSHSVILGGTRIGDRCVIAAGTVVRAQVVPPMSLVIGNPAVIKPGHYRERLRQAGVVADDPA